MSKSSLPEPVGDEMLSAYVDGELSPPEAQVVERWLKSSPQARQKVEEFRRLSGLMEELPREELPEEFALEVMASAERQMLLPVDRKVVPASIGRRVRTWALSVGASAAVAACLLIATQWNPAKVGPVQLEIAEAPPAPGPSGDQQVAVRAPESPSSRATQEGAQHRSQPMTKQAPPRATSIASEEADGTNNLKGAATEGPSPSPTPPSVAGAAEGGLQSLTPGRGSPGKEKRPGESQSVVEVLDQIKEFNAAGRIPVVRIFVVDRQDGLEVLQVLLEEKQIVRDKPVPEGGHEPNSVDHRALFVVASARELTSALKSLEASSEKIGRWMLAETVEMARFDQPSQDQIADVMAMIAEGRSESKSGIAVGAAAVPSLTEEASGEVTPDRPIADARPSRGKVKPSRATQSDREAALERERSGLATVPPAKPERRVGPTTGRQVLVTMSEATPPSSENTASRASNPGTARSSDGAGLPRSTDSARATSGGGTTRRAAPAGPPPMQVLFVIESEAVTPREAPPARESP